MKIRQLYIFLFPTRSRLMVAMFVFGSKHVLVECSQNDNEPMINLKYFLVRLNRPYTKKHSLSQELTYLHIASTRPCCARSGQGKTTLHLFTSQRPRLQRRSNRRLVFAGVFCRRCSRWWCSARSSTVGCGGRASFGCREVELFFLFIFRARK